MAKGVRTAIAHLIRTGRPGTATLGRGCSLWQILYWKYTNKTCKLMGTFVRHSMLKKLQGFLWPGESFSSWKADSERVGTTHARGVAQLPVKNTNTDLFNLLLFAPIIWSSIAALHFLVCSLSIDNLHIEFLRHFFKHL